MGNMKFWWIFGFEWWGELRPAEMRTAKGDRYIPLFLGIWLRRRTPRAADECQKSALGKHAWQEDGIFEKCSYCGTRR